MHELCSDNEITGSSNNDIFSVQTVKKAAPTEMAPQKKKERHEEDKVDKSIGDYANKTATVPHDISKGKPEGMANTLSAHASTDRSTEKLVDIDSIHEVIPAKQKAPISHGVSSIIPQDDWMDVCVQSARSTQDTSKVGQTEQLVL